MRSAGASSPDEYSQELSSVAGGARGAGGLILGRAHPSERVLLMGILNVTPDSFSDGGRFLHFDDALAQCERMLSEGADIIDVGGESTRPGSGGVSVGEELDRVIPIIERLNAEFDTVISVDTSKPAVMREAVEAGAGMINDVRALQAEGALHAAASLRVPLCLMHMQGDPLTMQLSPNYGDVVAEVRSFLEERATACESAGIAPENIVIDPGFGFGKNLDHNLRLMACLDELAATGRRVMVGFSRKAMIGKVLGRSVDERLYGTLALAVYAVLKGASILRVHDVGPTSDVLKMVSAVRESIDKGAPIPTLEPS